MLKKAVLLVFAFAVLGVACGDGSGSSDQSRTKNSALGPTEDASGEAVPETVLPSSTTVVDFSGQVIECQVWQGRDLRNANFDGAVLREVDARGANLEGANFIRLARADNGVLKELTFERLAVERCGRNRELNPPQFKYIVDFRGLNLRGAKFGYGISGNGGYDYVPTDTEVQQRRMDVKGYFDGADLTGATFENALIYTQEKGNDYYYQPDVVSFSRANLSRANLRGLMAVETLNFVDANLSQADLSGAMFTSTFAQWVCAESPRLGGPSADEVLLANPHVCRNGRRPLPADTLVCRIREVCTKTTVNFSRADFSGANLTDVMMAGPVSPVAPNTPNSGRRWPGAVLRGANFRDATLVRADLRGADLTGADLTGADLTGALLDGAILDGAILPAGWAPPSTSTTTTLTPTTTTTIAATTTTTSIAPRMIRTFQESRLSGSDMRFQDVSELDYSRSLFEEAQMSRLIGVRTNFNFSSFWRANLEAANLSGASLIRANFGEADLRDANLNNTLLLNASFVGADMASARVMGASGGLPNGSFSERCLGNDRVRLPDQERGRPFCYRELRSPDFESAVLTGASFRFSDMSGAYFTSADLAGANFNEAILQGANFSMAQMNNAQASDANFNSTRFFDANLTGVRANWSSFKSARFAGAVVVGMNFFRAQLTNAHFEGVDLEGVSFEHADLMGADFSNVSSSGGPRRAVNMNYCYCRYTNFAGARLRSARLVAGVFLDANFSGADFADANFERSEFDWGSDFSGANFSGANFSGADLRGSRNLNSANLAGANMSGAQLPDWFVCETSGAINCPGVQGGTASAPPTTVRATTTTVSATTTTVKAPSTTAKAPTTTVKAPTTTVKAPSTTAKAPTTTVKAPSTTAKAPTTTVKAPSTTAKAPTTTVKAPSTTAKAPTTTVKAPTTTIKK